VVSRRNSLCFATATVLALTLSNTFAHSQQKPDVDPIEIVRAASQNEIKATDVQHYCMFKDSIEYKDHSVVREIIRTNQGGLWTTLLMNGKPLTAEERQKDKDRLTKFANNPEARRKRREANKAEDQRASLMLSSLPDAFLYTYVGTDRGPAGEELVHLKFKPNPSFNPPNHETAIYQGMEGDLTIDRKAMRIAKIDGTLFKDVDFGWGILGRLYKGGKFIIVQRDVGNGAWEEVQENLQFNGKILMVKSLTVSSNETMTDFRPVPENLTTAQALDLLQKSVDVVAENDGGVKEAQNTGHK
jgi:hypothetical protein